jgi:hypothetical protein
VPGRLAYTCRACGRISDLLAEAAHYPGGDQPPASFRNLVSWRGQVLARVREVIATPLGLDPSKVRAGALLQEDLGLDYLRLETGTVGQVADYVAARA